FKRGYVAMKECRRCFKIKSSTEFYKRTASQDGLQPICKPCSIEVRREHYQTPHGKKLRSAANKRAKFNMTAGEYNELFDSQEGRCAICKRHQSEFSKSFAIDHNHDTGKIRGLLCHQCNTALGMLRENPEAIKEMLA